MLGRPRSAAVLLLGLLALARAASLASPARRVAPLVRRAPPPRACPALSTAAEPTDDEPDDEPATAGDRHWPTGVPVELERRLAAAGYARPTAIQKRALRPIGLGVHVAIHAPTGAGKTVAFLAPVLARLANERAAVVRAQKRGGEAALAAAAEARDLGGVHLLLVAPTVELAVQLGAVVATLTTTAPLVLAQDGVDAVEAQRAAFDAFARRRVAAEAPASGTADAEFAPRVVVGTAKRLGEVLGKSDRRWSELRRSLATVVLDEVDLMLPAAARAEEADPYAVLRDSRGRPVLLPGGRYAPLPAAPERRGAGGRGAQADAAEPPARGSFEAAMARRLAQKKPAELLLEALVDGPGTAGPPAPIAPPRDFASRRAAAPSAAGAFAAAAAAAPPRAGVAFQVVLASATMEAAACARVNALLRLGKPRRAPKGAPAADAAAAAAFPFEVVGAEAPHSAPRLRRRGAASVRVPATIRHVAYLVKEDTPGGERAVRGLLAAHAELNPAAAIVILSDSASVAETVRALREGGLADAVALHKVLGLGEERVDPLASTPAGGATLERARTQRAKLSASFARRSANPTVVTTESAARGLDLKAVDAVLLAQPPRTVDSYVHAAGRTGRQGRRGTVVTLVPPSRRGFIDELRRELGIVIDEIDMTKLGL
jgi:superfamily II DNA/RNA helicase